MKHKIAHLSACCVLLELQYHPKYVTSPNLHNASMSYRAVQGTPGKDCAVLCCAVLCCAVLRCAALCRAVPCRAVLCWMQDQAHQAVRIGIITVTQLRPTALTLQVAICDEVGIFQAAVAAVQL